MAPNVTIFYRAVWLVAAAFFFFATAAAFSEPPKNPVFAVRAGKAYRQAKIEFHSRTNDSTAVDFARTCFDWADFATNDDQCAEIAREGINACQHLLARTSNSAAGHYYLAMNFGQLAKAEAPSIASYKLVKEMEREFKTAGDLDGKYDFAGPARSLGLLYRDAPGWPISIGSKHKAREWLEYAAAAAPDYPENRLNLAESLVHWKNHEDAEKQLNALDALWSKAKTNFTGEAWEPAWADWSPRREALRQKLKEMSTPPKPARK